MGGLGVAFFGAAFGPGAVAFEGGLTGCLHALKMARGSLGLADAEMVGNEPPHAIRDVAAAMLAKRCELLWIWEPDRDACHVNN